MIQMKIFNKHGEDFSGGLNTVTQVDGIAENQLADVLNMEIDFSTGKLQTVSGTKDILSAEKIFAAIYDSINHLILLVKNDKKIFLADFDGTTFIGLELLLQNILAIKENKNFCRKFFSVSRKSSETLRRLKNEFFRFKN